MIKISILYPNAPGAWFDHDYYRQSHLPLIECRLGSSLEYYAIDRGMMSSADAPAPFIAACHLLCRSLEAYESANAPHAQEIRADIANFTDRIPVKQVSEVVVEHSARPWGARVGRAP